MRSVFTAVSTNTRSPHTAGVELPFPGIAAFHLMLVFASHLVGGSAFGAEPSAFGPRQWCQFASLSLSKSAATTTAEPRTSASEAERNRVMSDSVTGGMLENLSGVYGPDYKARQGFATRRHRLLCLGLV